MIVRMSDASLDLDAIEQDLNEVERAMERLESGTYFTDEVTGAPLDEGMLAQRPTARHA
jgi:RNA polymerase-binding transcription factor DksA